MIMHTKQTPGCAEEFLQQVHSQDDRVRSARFSVAAPSHGVHLTRWRFCTQTEARSDDTELKMSADQRYCKGQVCIYVHSPKIRASLPPNPRVCQRYRISGYVGTDLHACELTATSFLTGAGGNTHTTSVSSGGRGLRRPLPFVTR